jgi:WD40 repeat protein
MYQHTSKPAKQTPIRPINETLKFDSLDDITRAASFHPICVIEDQQAIRAVDIHPSGNYYVVGSNSKCLRVCPYPNLSNIKSDYQCKPASVLYKKSKHHYGSIYCTAWNPAGNLIATGSNDKTIKLIKFTPDLIEDNDFEIELTYHNGTVRDLIFMQQEDNNILISGGAGDCKIHVLDCQTQQSLRVYTGHTGHIYTMHTWAGTKNVFVSGSQDKSCKFWDLRAPESIQTFTPSTTLAMQGSPVAAVAVDPSGLLLSSGHEDAACCLYDIRGSRIVQIYKPHTSDIRSVRFSTNAYYLLTSSYDNKVIITDLHGDLTKPLNWSVVAQHNDKVIQAKWHPNHMSFITTSADRTSVVWSLPSNMLANTSVI